MKKALSYSSLWRDLARQTLLFLVYFFIIFVAVESNPYLPNPRWVAAEWLFYALAAALVIVLPLAAVAAWKIFENLLGLTILTLSKTNGKIGPVRMFFYGFSFLMLLAFLFSFE